MCRFRMLLAALVVSLAWGCNVTDEDQPDVGDPDTNQHEGDADVGEDVDVEEDADTGPVEPPMLEVIVTAEPGPDGDGVLVLGEGEEVTLTFSCEPSAECAFVSCELEDGAGATEEFGDCSAGVMGEVSLTVTAEELMEDGVPVREGEWSATVTVELTEFPEEDPAVATVAVWLVHGFDAGLEGEFEEGVNEFLYLPVALEAFCEREACELSCEWDEEGAGSCEGLEVPNALESALVVRGCATDLPSEWPSDVGRCVERTYSFEYREPAWEQVSAGGSHTCGILEDGSLWCWGSGGNGRLGVGDNSDSSEPVNVEPGTTWEWVSAGGAHTCGVREGDLYCWGEGTEGQVDPESDSDAAFPVLVNDEQVWERVSAGGEHSCGLTTGGALYCWGRNHRQQLGAFGDVGFHQVEVGSITGWSDVSAGEEHTCAVTADGDANAWCWGERADGRLDGIDAGTNEPRLVQLAPGSPTETTHTVHAGERHSCALVDDADGAYCWGHNNRDQLGRETATNVGVVGVVTGGHDFERLTTGGEHTCGVTVGGDAYCWGFDSVGQAGGGGGGASPAIIDGLDDVSDISAGDLHTCAIAEGWVHCWGDADARLGKGPGPSSSPGSVVWPGAPSE
jgi:alpha-tubulin suppressor-like RCC1 family protein